MPGLDSTKYTFHIYKYSETYYKIKLNIYETVFNEQILLAFKKDEIGFPIQMYTIDSSAQ